MYDEDELTPLALLASLTICGKLLLNSHLTFETRFFVTDICMVYIQLCENNCMNVIAARRT